MTLAEIIQEVYVQTGRPDLVSETAAAVRSVTMQAHSINEFDLDEYTTILTNPDPTKTLVTISLDQVSNSNIYHLATSPTGIYHLVIADGAAGEPANVAPPVRKILAVCTLDDNLTPVAELRRLPPSTNFDMYGLAEVDMYRVVGSSITFRTVEPVKQVAVQYLSHPKVTANTVESWIFTAAPYYIIHMAAGAILGPICGKLDEANAQRQMASTHLGSILDHIRQ